jgi:hypothetical protein
VLLIAVLLGSLLVSRVGGVRVAGGAVAVSRAETPRVGDCVREVTGSLAVASRGGFPPLPLSVVSVGETSVSFSNCSDQHVGEVAAFRRTPPAPSGGVVTGGSDTDWCGDVAEGYRDRTIWRFRDASGRHWDPVTNQRFVAILGSSSEYSWAVCAALAPGLELYSGSYLDVPAGRPAPPPFGLCRSGGNPDRRISCTSPHRVQQFGIAVQASISPPVAIDECARLVQAMTGLPDVTAGGVLRVEVVGGGAAASGGDRGRCESIALGPNRLIGTLIGIGTGTLPLA